MTSATTTPPPSLAIKPGYRGVLALSRALGLDLAPFQRQVLRAAYGPERELAVILPRGHGKSTLAALLAIQTLATAPGETVAIGSTSRQQARIVRDLMEEHVEHPVLAGRLQLFSVQGERPAARWDGGGTLSVLSGNGSRAVGRTDRLMLMDEAWSLSNARQGADLLGALQTSMAKSRDGGAPRGRLVVISTAAPNLDSPLGRMRARALAGTVTRKGAHIDATVPGVLRWLEWSVPDEADLEDDRQVKAANPAPWITRAVLAEQRQRNTPLDFAQHHANRWGVGAGSWLPPAAWSACRAEYAVVEHEEVVVGVDVGGARAETAVIAVTPDLRVAAVRTFLGDDAVLKASAAVRDLARQFTVREVAYDPWRFQGEALRLEAEGIGPMVDFPQSHARMVPASEGLHAAIVEGRLRHLGHPDLDRHVANAVAKQTPRGWRLEQAAVDQNIDGAVALAMAVERASAPQPTFRVLGWV